MQTVIASSKAPYLRIVCVFWEIVYISLSVVDDTDRLFSMSER